MTAGRLEIALRTIVVTTRTAIIAHRRAGNDVLVRASAHQGLGLLEDLESRLPPDAPEEARKTIGEARRELVAFAEGQ